MVDREARDQAFDCLMNAIQENLDGVEDFMEEYKIEGSEDGIINYLDMQIFMMFSDKNSLKRHEYRVYKSNNKISNQDKDEMNQKFIEHLLESYLKSIIRILLFLKTNLEFVPLETNPLKKLSRYVSYKILGKDYSVIEKLKENHPFPCGEAYWEAKKRMDLPFEMIEEKIKQLFNK